tara:strand:+ start:502 stop:1992 length:1491 start_codon:yes stop_codon:yes gene_type:complete
MQKHNSIAKKIKKQILSINLLIESYFNQLKNFNVKNIKAAFDSNNKLFWGLSIFAILTISYFLAPTAYDKSLTKSKIKNQVLNRYGVDLKFNKKLTYNLLPKPHFKSKDLSLIENGKVIGNVKNFKIFISIDRLYSFERFETKDLIFDKTEFNLNKNDFNFFYKLLKIEPSKNNIIIKNSKIFFRDNVGELLFINRIPNGKFYYDANNLENIFSSKNEVFKIPFKVIVKNDKFNKKLFFNFNSKKIRLDIENEIDYTNSPKIGILDILFINKGTVLNYTLNNNNLTFNSKSKKNNYEGSIDFKPFYLTTKLKYDGLSFKNLFKNDSILIELIKNELLNNKNLNALIKLEVNDITNIDELNNLLLNININEGSLNLSESEIIWKNDLKIKFAESELIYDQNEIELIGSVILDFINIGDFYKSFQVKKINRKKIDQIKLDFKYNFDSKKINFDNVRIDNKPNLEVQRFLDDFNNDINKILNKITFKNFVSNFIETYAG